MRKDPNDLTVGETESQNAPVIKKKLEVNDRSRGMVHILSSTPLAYCLGFVSFDGLDAVGIGLFLVYVSMKQGFQ